MRMMRTAHILWLGATTVAIGALLLTLQTRPERGEAWERFEEQEEQAEARSDQPDAAAQSDLARRRPTDGRTDLPRFYEAAARQITSLARFSSAIGRDIPFAQPASRVWLSGSRVM
jgi:hypothetical protein